MFLSLKVMFAEDCRSSWVLHSISQCLAFVGTWQLRFFWGDIHVGQLPIAPFCLVHIIMFWFCACLRVAASLYCRVCVTSGCNNLFGKRGPNLDLSVGLVCSWLSTYWSELCSGGLTRVVLVGHAVLLLVFCSEVWVWVLKFWSECWFEIGMRLAQSGLQGFRQSEFDLNFGLYWSEIGLEFRCGTSDCMLCEFFFWNFGLKTCLNYGHSFGLRLVSRLVCGKLA